MASSPVSLGLRIAILVTAVSVAAMPAYAGLDKGKVTVDSAIVYLGVVPAVQTRNYSAEHTGDMAMGGAAANDINNIHLVVALFDHLTGKRITNAQVSARFLGERGRRWSVMLKPMTVNGLKTYGGYSNMGADIETSIFIDVVRPFGSRAQKLTARFEYSHD